MVKRNRIAIIPARGGSKRLPGKNIIDFFGKPLLAWSIQAARKSGLFDRVFVSTEDKAIAAIATDHGAEVPFLRTSHSDDHSNISDVTVHALRQIEQKLGETFATVTMLQATCPLRDAADIHAAIETFDRSDVEFQMSCFEFHWSNPWWSFRRDEAGHGQWLFPDMIGVRSQDQPRAFGITGAICIAKSAPLMQTKTFNGPGQRFEPISWTSAIDIDDEEDLRLARAAYLLKQGLV